jgi:hypothetical protein
MRKTEERPAHEPVAEQQRLKRSAKFSENQKGFWWLCYYLLAGPQRF